MPRRLLLDAADVYPRASAPENRLTEILAEVLRTSPELLHWLATRAFVDAASDDMRERCAYGSYCVETQFSLRGGSERPDIRVRFVKGRSPEDHTFYIEDKLYAGPTDAQRRGYPATEHAPVILLRLEDRPWLAGSRFSEVTWTEVVREILRLGRTWADPADQSWPSAALAPDAPSEYRLLAELSNYLAREIHVDAPLPLTERDLEILPRAPLLLARWDWLFHLIERQLADAPGLRQGQGGYRWEPDGPVDKQTTLGWDLRLEPTIGWPALDQHWASMDQERAPAPENRWTLPSLIMYPGAPWDPRIVAEPAIGVGVSVEAAGGWLPGLADDGQFRRAAATADFSFGTTWKGRVGRVFKTKLLRDVATPDTTLHEQAQAIVSWARDVLAELMVLEPDEGKASTDGSGGPAGRTAA